MLIYLLRHGRAEDGFGMSDSDRALTDDGRRRLHEAAPAWRRLIDDLDVVVTSPLLRARETAAVLVDALGGDPAVRVDARIVPGGDPAQALELVGAELGAGTGGIAFVGHEPHLGGLLGLLLTGDAFRAMPLKKGMLVAVELPSSTSLVGSLRFALTQKAAAQLA